MGRTGSGKTHLSTWLLSHAAFDRMPYIILDYKRDQEMLAKLEKADLVTEISINKSPPKKKGLYIVHPRPDEQEAVEKFLWKIWDNERIGLYVDEAHMLGPHNAPFQALLTQGRSKKIPVITVTQKPAWISRFVFSEADFYSVFGFNDIRDQKTVNNFVPVDLSKRLDEHWSHWYDVKRHKIFILAPVPNSDTILDRFQTRLKGARKWSVFT